MCSSWINWWLVCSYVLLIFRGNVQSKRSSYYVINAAGSIFTGRPYGVVVTIFNSAISSSCVVSLKGPNLDMKMQYNLTPQDPCRLHQFKMPATLEDGEYTLTVESIRGQYYRNSTRLNWEDTKSFVKIQTPKNHYRPGEGIRFRVLYFNEQLKPVQAKSTSNIQIYDGNNNFVATYKNIATRDGIYRGKFKLATNPVFGLWRICILESNIVMGDCAYFRVKQYEIPPFKVRLQAKRYVALSDNSLPVFVKAYYASENHVEGNVNLFVQSYLDKQMRQTPVNVHLTKRLKSGKSEFNISLAQFKEQIPESGELLIHITAAVNEGYTSDSANTTKMISLYRKPFIVECIHTTGKCRKLIGDKENIITYRITKLDGEIADKKLPVKLHYSSLSSSDKYSFTSELKPNGVVNFPNVKILKSQSQNANNIVFKTEIEFQGIRNPMPNTTMTWIIARTFHVGHDKRQGRPHLHTRTKGLSVPAGTSQYVHFDVDHRYEYASCVVMSNGNVQAAHPVLPDVFGTVETKINFNQNMWPFVNLFLYGLERNTLFVALKTIGIQEERNTISIEAPQRVSPGDRIKLKVSTSPFSYVGLIATDEVLYDLGERATNDLSAKELTGYLNKLRASPAIDQRYLDLPSEKWGLVTLTNAPYVKKACITACRIQRRTKRRTRTKKIKRVFRTENIPKDRRNFADVWLFEMLRSSASGSNTWEFVVPDRITTWRLNAFSMHRTRGLTVLESPIYIQSGKPLYLSTNLPYSIKKGEVLRLPVTCFNQHTEELEVTLQLSYNTDKMILLDEQNQNISKTDIEMTIGPSDFDVAFFYIKPLENGMLPLNFSAKTSKDLNDILYHELKVEEEVEVNVKSMSYIQSNYKESKTENLPINLSGIQQRSPKPLKCLITNQLIMMAWLNLENFHPFDNGEESISKLLSSLYLWDYMKSQLLLNAEWRRRFKTYFNDGFQAMLRFRKHDGGFSYYAQVGNNKSSCSSTWLSGYAMRALRILGKTKFRDETIMRETKLFLLSRRRKKTHFIEGCETPTRNSLSNLKLTREIYEVLNLSVNPNDDKLIRVWLKQELKKNKTDAHLRDDTNSGETWLNKREALENAGSILLSRKSSHNMKFEKFQWLMGSLYSEYNFLNCFESSVAEQGIYEYLKCNPIYGDRLRVKIYDGSRKIKHTFNESLDSSMYYVTLTNTVNYIRINVKGRGQVFLQCNYLNEMENFRGNLTSDGKRYNLQVIPTINKQQLSVKACLERHDNDRVDYVGSIVKLRLPTGYVLTLKSVEKLQDKENVRQAVNDNTKLLVELKPLTSMRMECLEVQAKLMHQLDNLQPGKLVVYDVNAKQEVDILTYRVSMAAEKV